MLDIFEKVILTVTDTPNNDESITISTFYFLTRNYASDLMSPKQETRSDTRSYGASSLSICPQKGYAEMLTRIFFHHIAIEVL